MRKYTVFLGGYGSGKSELAINFALRYANEGGCILVDMDLANPYFRSSDEKELMAKAGIQLISPSHTIRGAELVNFTAQIFSVFDDGDENVILDVGGDAAGSLSLGRLIEYFGRVPKDNLSVLFVINPMRPRMETPEAILRVMQDVQNSSRLTIIGLINNSNLADETTVKELVVGYELVRNVSMISGIPVYATVGLTEPLKEFLENDSLDKRYIGKAIEINTNMRRTWKEFVKRGFGKF